MIETDLDVFIRQQRVFEPDYYIRRHRISIIQVWWLGFILGLDILIILAWTFSWVDWTNITINGFIVIGLLYFTVWGGCSPSNEARPKSIYNRWIRNLKDWAQFHKSRSPFGIMFTGDIVVYKVFEGDDRKWYGHKSYLVQLKKDSMSATGIQLNLCLFDWEVVRTIQHIHAGSNIAQIEDQKWNKYYHIRYVMNPQGTIKLGIFIRRAPTSHLQKDSLLHCARILLYTGICG